MPSLRRSNLRWGFRTFELASCHVSNKKLVVQAQLIKDCLYSVPIGREGRQRPGEPSRQNLQFVMSQTPCLVFRLYAPGLADGVHINVVGSPPTLGEWKPENGRKMLSVAHGWCEAVVPIPTEFRTSSTCSSPTHSTLLSNFGLFVPIETEATTYEYKYVIDYGDGAYQWEQTSNRAGCVSGTTTYVVDFFEHIGTLPEEEEADSEVRIMSFNIRFETPQDGIHNWSLRRAYVAEVIELWYPLVLGLQEVLHGQLQYLAEKLAHSYSYVGVGRDDGHRAGEYSPIFFNYKKVNLLDSGTFWLSETPWSVGSRSWDSACVRICTWAKLQLKDSQNSMPFFVFNTHLDHRSQKARVEGLKLIVNLFHAWTRFYPGCIIGDMNELPEEPAIVNTLDPSKAFPAHLKNAQMASESPASGPKFTFNNWDSRTDTYWIDYIFVKPNMKVKSFEVVEHSGEGQPISDHFPIVADLLLNLSTKSPE